MNRNSIKICITINLMSKKHKKCIKKNFFFNFNHKNSNIQLQKLNSLNKLS